MSSFSKDHELPYQPLCSACCVPSTKSSKAPGVSASALFCCQHCQKHFCLSCKASFCCVTCQMRFCNSCKDAYHCYTCYSHEGEAYHCLDYNCGAPRTCDECRLFYCRNNRMLTCPVCSTLLCLNCATSNDESVLSKETNKHWLCLYCSLSGRGDVWLQYDSVTTELGLDFYYPEVMEPKNASLP